MTKEQIKKGIQKEIESDVFIDDENSFRMGASYILDTYYTPLAESHSELVEALEKIIQMNKQHADDQYGDSSKADSWACVVVARTALSNAKKITNEQP